MGEGGTEFRAGKHSPPLSCPHPDPWCTVFLSQPQNPGSEALTLCCVLSLLSPFLIIPLGYPPSLFISSVALPRKLVFLEVFKKTRSHVRGLSSWNLSRMSNSLPFHQQFETSQWFPPAPINFFSLTAGWPATRSSEI